MNPPLGTTLLPDAVPVAPASVDPAPVPGSVGHRLAAEGLALAYGDDGLRTKSSRQIKPGEEAFVDVGFADIMKMVPKDHLDETDLFLLELFDVVQDLDGLPRVVESGVVF